MGRTFDPYYLVTSFYVHSGNKYTDFSDNLIKTAELAKLVLPLTHTL